MKSYGDKAHHPNRRVDRDSFFNRYPNKSTFMYPNKSTFIPVEGSFTPHEPDPNGEGEPDTPEDAQERADLSEERRKEHGW